MKERLTHLDEQGRARMVDVSDKADTAREAIAQGRIRMRPDAFQLALSGDAPKGDVRAIAEIAGVMAAKRTSELIPLCHPIALSNIKVTVTADASLPGFTITALTGATAQTGVEMEALTAVSVACLTLYDMLKAIDRAMIIEQICLMQKHGGASGPYSRNASDA
jgi:cyclic pyranopterin phosphate synthase